MPCVSSNGRFASTVQSRVAPCRARGRSRRSLGKGMGRTARRRRLATDEPGAKSSSSKRRCVAPSAASSGSDEDGEYNPDTQDGAFFAALRKFGATIGVATNAPPPPPSLLPQRQLEPNVGRRSRRNRKAPDAWWEASYDSRREPSGRSSEIRPATPPGAPPAKRKSVRRSLATGRMSQSPAPALTKEAQVSAATAALKLKLEQNASELGLILRTATLTDVDNITHAHTCFEMDMAAWSPDAEPHLADADGIRGIIEDEGGERIVLLTREISRSSCDLLGFVYSFDETVQQSTYSGVSAYIAQVWLASSERGQGLGELLLCAAMASALSRGTQASHLFLCERNAGARRLYEKSGYRVDGDSGDPVHNLVLVNPTLTPEAIDDMLSARQAKHLSQTGWRKGGARRGPAKTVAAGPNADLSTDRTVTHSSTETARGPKRIAARPALVETQLNVATEVECNRNGAGDDEGTNAVCRLCQLPFYTASGRSQCVDCRTEPQRGRQTSRRR